MQTDDYIRSFGMSGLLISEELRGLEQRFNISLGHLSDTQQDATEYYPQFEQSVRQEAAQMGRHYELFYCLEQAIRKIITETLEEVDGANWWDNKVPPDVKKYVDDLKKKEIDNSITARSDKAIDYTTFGQLEVIITNNWVVFVTVFKSQRAVQKVMSSLNLLRGPIAHCCPLSEDEVDRLNLTVKDYFRMLG